MKNLILFTCVFCLVLSVSCDKQEDLQQGENFFQTVALYNGSGNALQADSYLKHSVVASVEDEGSEKQIQYWSSIFKENNQEVRVKLELSEQKVKQYNQTYGTSYEVFPENLITQFDKELIIEKGKVNSDMGTLKFIVSPSLKDNTPYMIAIEMQQTQNISPLKNTETLFYTFEKTKGQIKKVVKLTRKVYLSPVKGVNGIGSNFTMEGLVYVDKFRSTEDMGDAGITTFMGTEGNALMRFGDSGVQPNHLQASGTDIGFTFKPKTWYHIALVVQNGTTSVYVNGNKKAEFSSSRGLGQFYIGRSYNGNRGLPGMVSEIRLWNVARSASEISENMTYVSPKTQGLYAYWKMNTAEGKLIKDLTGNGRDLKCLDQSSQSQQEITIEDINGIELQ